MDHVFNDKLLNQLVAKLREAHGARLLSVILYGSGATGETHGVYSDLNVLAVLDQVTPQELASSETIFKWWRDKGNPAPLLMSAEEMRNSTDCFPIEFHDITDCRRVLYGDDLAAGLEIRDVHYRAQVEHELRAKLIRLRQKAAGVLQDRNLLLRLMCDSVSTFCVLGRHVLKLAGQEAPWEKHAVVARLRESFGIEGRALDMLLNLREGRARPRDLNPETLFGTYLEEISTLAATVDRLER